MIMMNSNHHPVRWAASYGIMLLATAAAFTPPTFYTQLPKTATTNLAALSERQQQFWEDVESGLDGIENYYNDTENLDIDRIRQFGRRCVPVRMVQMSMCVSIFSFRFFACFCRCTRQII